MPDIIRNSFDPTKRYQKVIYQLGRDVLDSELNEAQDICRVSSYMLGRPFGDDQYGIDYRYSGTIRALHPNALSVTPTGNNNEVSIAAGDFEVGGYVVRLAAPVTITLTAASQAIYVTLVESEITASDDPAIAVKALGETTRRTKLTLTFHVGTTTDWYDLQSMANPYGSGTIDYVKTRTWEGNTTKFLVAHVLRGAMGAVVAANIVNRVLLPVSSELAQNFSVPMWLEVDGYVSAAIVTSVFTVTIHGLRFTLPGTENVYRVYGAWQLAAGQAIVLSGGWAAADIATDSRTGFALRRRGGTGTSGDVVTITSQTSTPDVSEAYDYVQARVVNMDGAVLDAKLFVIAYCPYTPTNQLVLRDGTTVNAGQFCTNLSDNTFHNQDMTDPRHTPFNVGASPRKVYAGPDAAPVSIIDTYGFSGSQISEYRQTWQSINRAGVVAADAKWIGLATDGPTDPWVITATQPFTYGRAASIRCDSYAEANHYAYYQRLIGQFQWKPSSVVPTPVPSYPEAPPQFLAELEWDMALNEALSAGSNSVDFIVGMIQIAEGSTAYLDPTTNIAGFGFYKSNYEATLQCYVGNGTTSTYASVAGSARSAGVPMHCRLVFGECAVTNGSVYGPGISFYLDGHLVVDFDDSAYLPDGSNPLCLFAGVKTTGGNAVGILYVSELVCRWRRSLKPMAY